MASSSPDLGELDLPQLERVLQESGYVAFTHDNCIAGFIATAWPISTR